MPFSSGYQYLIREGAWVKKRKSALCWEVRTARFVALCAIWVWPLPMSIQCTGWSRILQRSVSLQFKPILLSLRGFCQGLEDKCWSGIIWQRQPDIETLKDKRPGFWRKTAFGRGYRRYWKRLLHLQSWFSWCHYRNRDITWQCHGMGAWAGE